jgi:hypothetical protein
MKLEMIETELVEPKKYTSVTIPTALWIRMQNLIENRGVFKSVGDYVAFVLRDVVLTHEDLSLQEPFSSKDLERVMKDFKALGAL